MIQKLINKIANKLDSQGKFDKADRLDNFVMKFAQEDREPTMEELMAEEKWLEDEGIDPYSMTDEDAMSGLEGEDRGAAEEFLGGRSPEDIRGMISKLQNNQDVDVQREVEQQGIMQQLSDALLQGRQRESQDPMRVDRGQFMMPEASSFMTDLVKLSDMLDEQGMHKEADYFTNMLEKIAQEGPDDFFGEEGGLDDWDDAMEPTTEELTDMEGGEDDQFYQLLGFVERVSKGMYMDMSAAQDAARDLINGFDLDSGVPDPDPELESSQSTSDFEPDNILEFPGV
jgi:hypothetical protein